MIGRVFGGKLRVMNVEWF